MLAARLEPGYRHRDEPVSALAAKGSLGAKVMVPGFLGLGVGTLALARDLRGSEAAPSPVPAMVALAGFTTAGAGLARCSDRTCPSRFLGDLSATPSDDLHAIFSAATFLLWIAAPIVAGRRAKETSSRYRRWCHRLGLSTLIALLVNGLLARRPSERWSGAAQRVMLASALAWYPLAATTPTSRG